MTKISRAIILAAGQGSRLMPLTADRPKCLVPVGTACFLERTIRALLQASMPHITIVTGYHAPQVASFVREHFPNAPVQCLFNADWNSANNFSSLATALTDNTNDFILIDGDLLFETPLLTTLLGHPAKNGMIIDDTTLPPPEEAMKITLRNGTKTIQHLGKQLPPASSGGEYIGLAKFSAAWAQTLQQCWAKNKNDPAIRQGYYEDAISRELANQEDIAAIPIGSHRWAEVDTVSDLAEVTKQWE